MATSNYIESTRKCSCFLESIRVHQQGGVQRLILEFLHSTLLPEDHYLLRAGSPHFHCQALSSLNYKKRIGDCKKKMQKKKRSEQYSQISQTTVYALITFCRKG